MQTHSLYSQNKSMPIAFFEKFDKAAIKEAIVKALKEDDTDTIEHCKEFNKTDIKKYYGNEILNFYQCNPFTKEPCLLIIKGNREFYKKLN